MDAKVTLTYKRNNGNNSTINFSGFSPEKCDSMTTVKAFMTKVNEIRNGTPTKYSRYVGETAEYVAD